MSSNDPPRDKRIPEKSQRDTKRTEDRTSRERGTRDTSPKPGTSGENPRTSRSPPKRRAESPDDQEIKRDASPKPGTSGENPRTGRSPPKRRAESPDDKEIKRDALPKPGKEKLGENPGTSQPPPKRGADRPDDQEIRKESERETKIDAAKSELSKEPQKQNPKWKRFIRNVGIFFGVVDELNLHLWREAFERRIIENDIGLSIRNSFGCLIPVFTKCHRETKAPRRVEENDTTEKKRDIDKKVDKRKVLPLGDGGYGYAGDGLAYYFYLQKIESLIPQGASGQAVPTFRQKNIVELCKNMYVKTEDMPEDEVIKLNYEITENLRAKPYNTPLFIIILTIIQIMALIATLVMGGIEIIGVHPKVVMHKDIITFRGKENVDVWIRPNIWIGAPLRKLIAVGSVYSPCMRTDWAIAKSLREQSFGDVKDLGCCVVKARGIAGTTTMKECNFLTVDGGKWYEKKCSEFSQNASTILRPCCFGLLGNCKMTTEKGCKIHSGQYFDSGPEHCSEAFCFPFFCGSVGLERSSKLPYMPARSNQGWRLLVSVIFHAGILHFILVALMQWILGRPIEGMGGWLRIGLIHLLTSIGSNLVGAFFDPYLPQMGTSGGVCGLVGIALIEVGQARRQLGRSIVIREVLSLLAIAFILFLTGFFPLINNFTHIGGFMFGIPFGVLFLPHLCFNDWSCKRRKFLVIVSAVFLLILIIFFFALFYLIQDTGFCHGCYVLSCFSFTDRMCDLQMDLIGTITRD